MNHILIYCFTFIFLSTLSQSVAAQTVYKYKDEKGKWVFSDQPPASAEPFEEKEYQTKTKKAEAPQVFIREKDNGRYIMVKNPFYAPIEVEIQSPLCQSSKKQQVVAAKSTGKLCGSEDDSVSSAVRYRWALGDPNAKEDGTLYQIPMGKGLERRITQSFHGPYSHHQEPSLYAVDIAMPVGTNLQAARSGVVVHVKDDYHMGGSTQFFLDKANFVRILHDDGTFADYAHILMGTATVKPGDQVETGDVIARSGSSGFSNGPHLHFVIRKNIGFEYRSVPFRFIDHKGKRFEPKAGMMVKGE